jgi:hypothetical protein
MSNFNDLVKCKPITRVEDTLREITIKLDCMKVDIGEIKSDLDIIKSKIKQEETILNHQVKRQEELSRGWFFTY